MSELRSDDGRYLAVQQGDQNFVVYDQVRGVAVFDRWSYEAQFGGAVVPPVMPPDQNANIIIPAPPSGAARILRVTSEQDGTLLNRGYSYWPQAWYAPNGLAYVFCGHADGHPRFFSVNLTSGNVERFVSLLDQFGYTGTGEGLYWDRDGWIYIPNGPVLRRVNPFTGEMRDVFSIEASFPGHRVCQTHSSDDGTMHSATVQEVVEVGAYPNVGTIVFWHGEQRYFAAQGSLDESQITPDGAFVIIKEDDHNRIIELATHVTQMLSNADGAVGHSDCGPGMLIGEDDQHGECVRWDLTLPLTADRRRTLFKTWNLGHVSVRSGRCLLSDATMLSLVSLDGDGVTPLEMHGMVSDGTYDTQVFANLDHTGRVAAFMSNHGGHRLDLDLLVL